MILHPGILALLVGSLHRARPDGLGGAAGAAGSSARWDRGEQLRGAAALERKTYLVSTLLSYAFGFELMSLFLFIYTVDDIHPLFIGAMCATGSLNANPVGWPALGLKIALFFAAPAWLAMNRLDQRAEDTPLVRLKYPALLAILPLAAWISTCSSGTSWVCGPRSSPPAAAPSSAGESGVAAELAGLPARPMMWAFYLCAAALVAHRRALPGEPAGVPAVPARRGRRRCFSAWRWRR